MKNGGSFHSYVKLPEANQATINHLRGPWDDPPSSKSSCQSAAEEGSLRAVFHDDLYTPCHQVVIRK